MVAILPVGGAFAEHGTTEVEVEVITCVAPAKLGVAEYCVRGRRARRRGAGVDPDRRRSLAGRRRWRSWPRRRPRASPSSTRWPRRPRSRWRFPASCWRSATVPSAFPERRAAGRRGADRRRRVRRARPPTSCCACRRTARGRAHRRARGEPAARWSRPAGPGARGKAVVNIVVCLHAPPPDPDGSGLGRDDAHALAQALALARGGPGSPSPRCWPARRTSPGRCSARWWRARRAPCVSAARTTPASIFTPSARRWRRASSASARIWCSPARARTTRAWARFPPRRRATSASRTSPASRSWPPRARAPSRSSCAAGAASAACASTCPRSCRSSPARACPTPARDRTANPREVELLTLADPETTVVRRRTELLGKPEPASRGAEEVTSAAGLVAALTR